MLTPDTTYTACGCPVKVKIIPDGTVWRDTAKAASAGFEKGSLYKAQRRLSGNTGRVQYVTVHNTDDSNNAYDDGELYTRATLPNENMGAARVHFYVDDVCAWQNLKAGTSACPQDPKGSAEVGWHAGDGSVSDGGNQTSLSLEIIMGDVPVNDAKARDNGARLAAYLLHAHGLSLDRLVTHTYWVNKAAGKRFASADEQSVSPIYGKKWCPQYILGTSAAAPENWRAFKVLVGKYLDSLSPAKPEEPKAPEGATPTYWVQLGSFSSRPPAEAYQESPGLRGFSPIVVQDGSLFRVRCGPYATASAAGIAVTQLCKLGYTAAYAVKSAVAPTAEPFKVGDRVMVNPGVTTYANGVKMAAFVPKTVLYVRRLEDGGKTMLVSTASTGTIYTGRIRATDAHRA